MYQALTLGIVHFLAMENIRDAFKLMKLYKDSKPPTTGKVQYIHTYFLFVKKNL